mgnify:CR=1 FL=1|jgi:hypothetical protein
MGKRRIQFRIWHLMLLVFIVALLLLIWRLQPYFVIVVE